MTGKELRATRRRLDLTQPQLAKRLDIGLRSVQAYEARDEEVPVVVALAVGLLTADQELGRLRQALIEAGRAAGAYLSDDVSNEFLMLVPQEIKLKLQGSKP